MNIFFARLRLGGDCAAVDFESDRHLLLERRGDEIWFGVERDGVRLLIESIYAIMRSVVTSTVCRDAELVWLFSSVAVRVADMPLLLARWRETGEPPLLSIIALDLAETRHGTVGLKAFCGFELAATFRDSFQSRDAARNLALLARHVLMKGGLAQDVAYRAIDGDILRLDWSPTTASPDLITIVL